MNVVNQLYKPIIVLFVVPLTYNLFSFADGSQNVTNQTTVPARNLTNLVEERFTRPDVMAGNVTLDPFPHVDVIYESPRMIVLFGYLITPAFTDNDDLWEAVDFLQNEHGFNLTHIVKEGVGSEGNEGRVYLIMETP